MKWAEGTMPVQTQIVEAVPAVLALQSASGREFDQKIRTHPCGDRGIC